MSQLNCFILNWNVRGLNNQARRENVRLLVQQMNATIVCLQETKLSQISENDVLCTLGPRFKSNFAFTPADGTRGGILLACNDSFFSLSSIVVRQYSLSIHNNER
jgi:exonuclease III